MSVFKDLTGFYSGAEIFNIYFEKKNVLHLNLEPDKSARTKAGRSHKI